MYGNCQFAHYALHAVTTMSTGRTDGWTDAANALDGGSAEFYAKWQRPGNFNFLAAL
jgi:hypothetical protein